MNRESSRSSLPPAYEVAERVFHALERFLHVEAVSGVVLLVSAAAALVWANSPAADSYHHFWHAPFGLSLGAQSISLPLHFWINDGLMTVFFLVVGMEIRREIHEGALSNMRLAALPVIAALGGVIVPAAIYWAFNPMPPAQNGWAIPMATDIAFAVGVLALLGRSIPSGVRVLLLALAIIDDIAAVLVIALFYSEGLTLSGVWIALGGVLLVLGYQRLGIRSALAYVVPGAVVWYGFYRTGVHPTLAGVLLGLMTPVVPFAPGRNPLEIVTKALDDFGERVNRDIKDASELLAPVKQLKLAQREIVPPVIRVQDALHPWVAYAVMPLFALANAGVTLSGNNVLPETSIKISLGVFVGLLLGKPIGIVLASWLSVRAGLCQLPSDVSWRGVFLVGCLGGIGFTMSIFISNLAFEDAALLGAAKIGILAGSAVAMILGLIVGRVLITRARRDAVA